MPNLDVSGPSNFPVRPLNKGMVRNLPTNTIPNGSFLRLQNYRVNQYGLKKRGGYITFDKNINDDAYFEYRERLEHLVYFYRKNAAPEMSLLTNRRLFYAAGNNVNTPYRLYDTVSVISNTEALTNNLLDIVIDAPLECYNMTRSPDRLISVDHLTDYGDIVSFGTYNAIDEQFTITIRATRDFTENELVGASLEIDHLFSTEENRNISYAVLPYTEAATASDEKMIIADQSNRGLYSLSAGNFEIFETFETIQRQEASMLTSAKGVTYFDDRLWVIAPSETDGVQYSQRIRWSFAGNFNVFQAQDYIDLPYTEGEIIALVPLGSLLVAYFTDAIYVGRQSSIIDLPYKFEKLETGQVGLVNQKAVTPWIDGHFFVGQDNIYFLSGSKGIQEIGSPVIEETLNYTNTLGLLNKIQVVHDPPTNSMAFYFPDATEEQVGVETRATRIWRWNYKTTAWSYDEVSYFNVEKTIPDYYYTGLLSSRLYIFDKTWQSYINLGSGDPLEENTGAVWERTGSTPSEIEAFSDYNTWLDLSTELRRFKKLYLPIYHATADKKQMIIEEDLETDQDYLNESEYPVWCLIESADYDLDTPDTTKTFTRITLKSFVNMTDRSAPLTEEQAKFTLLLSETFGYSWKRPKTLRFRKKYNEGKADFRCTGSALRFKLINNQVIQPYKLSEFVLRTIGKGLQVDK